MADHCRKDPGSCRPGYCACQCDTCYEAHFGGGESKDRKWIRLGWSHGEDGINWFCDQGRGVVGRIVGGGSAKWYWETEYDIGETESEEAALTAASVALGLVGDDHG